MTRNACTKNGLGSKPSQWRTCKTVCQSPSACAENALPNTRRKHITVSLLRKMRDSQHDGKSEIDKLSNSMFDHMAAQPFHTLREEREAVDAKRLFSVTGHRVV